MMQDKLDSLPNVQHWNSRKDNEMYHDSWFRNINENAVKKKIIAAINIKLSWMVNGFCCLYLLSTVSYVFNTKYHWHFRWNILSSRFSMLSLCNILEYTSTMPIHSEIPLNTKVDECRSWSTINIQISPFFGLKIYVYP